MSDEPFFLCFFDTADNMAIGSVIGKSDYILDYE